MSLSSKFATPRKSNPARAARKAGYKRPRKFLFIAFEDFPRSTSGKVQRHILEARLAD